MAENRIRVLIEMIKRGSGAKDAIGDLNKLDSVAGSLAGGLGGLAASAGVAGLVALGAAAASATVDLARAGASAAQTQGEFDKMAASVGESGSAMLGALRTASRGTIDNTNLMLTANRAMILGVADSSAEMASLLEVASARGKIMGLSTQQAFSDIVTGIGRMSPLILDNLGIVTGGEAVFERYAASIGRTADSLSEAERKQALVNSVISSSQGLLQAQAGSAGTAAESFQRMDAAITNLKDRLGQLFAPGIASAAEGIATAIDKLLSVMERAQQADAQTGWLSGISETLSSSVDPATRLTGYMLGLFTAETQVATGANQAATATTTLATTERQAAAATNVLATGVAALANTYPAAAQGALQLAAAARTATGMAALARNQLQGLASQLVNKQGAAAALSFVDEQNTALAQQIRQWQDIGYTQDDITNVLMPGYLAGLSESVNTLDEIPPAISAAENAFDALKGKVGGVLGEALNLDVGVNVDDLLPRQDAINEDARRLADVAVNGYASPWASYLNDKFPDLFQAAFDSGVDLKPIAATALRDFEDGLRPELLDKERAKDRVRRMILGEERMADIAQEIASELSAEMGSAAPANLAGLVGTALGGSAGAEANGATTGASFATGLQKSIAEADSGTQITKAIDGQLRSEANIRLIANAGMVQGTAFVNNFLVAVQNLPAAVIRTIADLVAPYVQETQQTQTQLTEAAP